MDGRTVHVRSRLSVMTTVADVVGVLLLAAFAWFCWPPAALLVAGVASLVASWQLSAPPKLQEPEGDL